MGSWGLQHVGGALEDVGTATGSSSGTTVTASGSTNTKGSWAQLKAATVQEAYGIIVCAFAGSASVNYLVDIGVGAAAAEQVLIPNLLFCQSGGGNVPEYYYLPVRVPGGVRVAARCQSVTASATLAVAAWLMPAGPQMPPPFSRVTDYGATTASSHGTTHDPGGTANTKGTYTQLTASTTNPIKALHLHFGDAGDTARVSLSWLVDVAIGAAASEKIIVPNLLVACNSATDRPYQMPVAIPVTIPAGSRLSFRAQCSGNTAGDRTIDLLAYGID